MKEPNEANALALVEDGCGAAEAQHRAAAQCERLRGADGRERARGERLV